MKFIAFILLSATMLAAQASTPLPKPEQTQSPTPVPPSTTPEDIANAKQARAVLDQMIAALGGPAYLNIQDMEQQGRTYSFDHNGQPTSGGAPFVRYWKWPDKERVELLKHRDWILTYNGDNGNETTYHGTHPLEKKDLKDYLERRSYSLDTVLRQWLQQPGTALYYDGKTISESKQADQVTIMAPDRRSVTLYIDASDHLPLRKTYTTRDPETGERVEQAESFDNYRPIQGVQTPTRLTRYKGDMMTAQRFISTVTYNKGIPDSKFDLTSASK